MASHGSSSSRPGSLGRNVSFHLLWSSILASGMGDRLAMLAAYELLGLGGEVDQASIPAAVDFFFFLPYVFWSPIAGWLADRLPRKWLMFATDELRGVAVLSIFLLMPAVGVAGGPPEPWMIYTVMFFIGVMAATFVPAKLSIVPNVVGYEVLQRANAAVVVMGVIGNLLGFLTAIALTQLLGNDEDPVRLYVLASAMCYMVSGGFWAFLKTPFQPRRIAARRGQPTTLAGTFRDIHAGMVYAVRHRPVLVLTITAGLVWGGTSVYLPALATVNDVMLGGDTTQYYLLLFAVGFGMLIGGVTLGTLNAHRGGELLMVLGLAGSGVFIVLQMFFGPAWLAALLALATGFSASVLLIPLNTLLQRVTADYTRGRVFAAKEILVELGKVAAAGTIWLVPNTDPLMRPITTALAAALLVAAGYGLWRYVLRGPMPSRLMNLYWRIARLYAYSWHRLRVRGVGRVPSRGAGLLVSNHTAGVDPVLIQAATPRPIRFLMAREMMVWWLGFIWAVVKPIPVERGARDSRAARAAVAALESGELVGIFPEAGIDPDPAVTRPFAAGVGLIATRSGASIVPVHIAGTPGGGRVFGAFWRISHARVTFGQPVDAADLAGTAGDDGKASDRHEAVASAVRERVLELGEGAGGDGTS